MFYSSLDGAFLKIVFGPLERNQKKNPLILSLSYSLLGLRPAQQLAHDARRRPILGRTAVEARGFPNRQVAVFVLFVHALFKAGGDHSDDVGKGKGRERP